MPRIPIRVEPYSSPHLRQRHFKSKRDSILRALCTASYINGSHFAILWVNARGETEQYGSELLQPKLGNWFNPEVIAEARQMVLAGGQAQAYHDSGLAQIAERESELDDARTEGEEEEGMDAVDQMTTGAMLMWDPKADVTQDRRQSQQQDSNVAGQFHTLDFASTLKQKVNAPILRRTFSMPNTLQGRAQSVPDLSATKGGPASNRPPALDLNAANEGERFQVPQGAPSSSNPEYKALTIGNVQEVTAFLETRFRQLQQLVCKIVAKAWIKVIEPKKQTRYPYNKGDESKPSWWPEECRHKEPDHLMKPERISLLMTMLRSGKVPTNRLELATAEVAVFIPPDKINLLREIYRVAREEERFRNNEISGDTRLYVAASAAFNPALDDLNSPVPTSVRLTEDITPRSAPMQETSMEMQRSISHETPQFDEHDPFAEAADMQQGYAILPSQNFYYNNGTPSYADQASLAVAMNNAQNMDATNQNASNAAAMASQQFQQAQQHQMFLAQQAQAAQRRQSGPELGRTQAPYMTNRWPQNMSQQWPHSGDVFQQATTLESHGLHHTQLALENNAQNTFYQQQAGIMETPAKQTQQGRQDQQNLRSSPYLPTPLRSNIDGTYSASRTNQGVSFSDYLHSPRTAVPGGLNEEEMKDGYH